MSKLRLGPGGVATAVGHADIWASFPDREGDEPLQDISIRRCGKRDGLSFESSY